MSTLSGDAINNAMILGYIKRDNRKEAYEELIDREKNLIISILKYLYPAKVAELDKLEISFDFPNLSPKTNKKLGAQLAS